MINLKVLNKKAIKDNPTKVILVIADTITTREAIIRLGQRQDFIV